MEQGPELSIYFILTSIGFFVFIIFIALLILYFQKRKVQFLLQKEKDKADFENELFKVKTEIKEQNFQHIGRELHDNIGQILSVASLELQMLKDNPYPTSEEIGDLSRLIDKGLTELRFLSNTMNTNIIENRGLEEMIRSEFDRCRDKFDMECSISKGEYFSINQETTLILFRVFQESLSNTLKYARAKKIEVMLNSKEGFFEMKIKDDGIGFDQKSVKKGNGLHNLKKRAEMLSGQCLIESRLGTTINILFPQT